MKLPKSWDDITIPKYLEYYTILTTKADILDREVRVLSCLSGLPIKEIEALKTNELLAHIKSLNFLQELPSEAIPAYFKVNGNKYKVAITFRDMTAGQFINFNEVLKDIKPEDINYQMAELIACMCSKQEKGIFFENGKLSFSRYRYNGFHETSEEFKKHMNIRIAYPLFVFFCNVIQRLLPATKDYLMLEAKKIKRELKKQDRKGLKQILTGFIKRGAIMR